MPELPRVITTTSDASAPSTSTATTRMAANLPAFRERFSGAKSGRLDAFIGREA